ncbi:MAG: outer rane efflux protein [Polaromonas sp.]|nr:outer rane efflux protein [Polaromonas sp.]
MPRIALRLTAKNRILKFPFKDHPAGRAGYASLALCVLIVGLMLDTGAVLAQPLAAGIGSPNKATLSLEQFITLAIQMHPSVASRRAGLNAADAEIQAARQQYYPTPSLQLRQNFNESGTVFALQQPLWAGGRIDAGLNAANARSTAASAAIYEAQTALGLRATNAWQVWQQARGRQAANIAGIDMLGGYAQGAARRISAGAAPEVDRALVDARLAMSQADLAAARAAERSSLAQLSQMLGRPLYTQDLKDVTPDTSDRTDPGFAGDRADALETLIAQALKVSPTLHRARAEIDSASHEVTQKRAALWPTLSLRAEHQRSNGANSALLPSANRLLLVLDYSPGAGFSAGANADAASARLIGLQDSMENTQRELIEKVSADFEEYQSSKIRLVDLQRTLQANTQVLSSYERLFTAGKRGWFEVLNAARELTQAQTALADVNALHLASATRLRLHAGELLGPEATPQTTQQAAPARIP